MTNLANEERSEPMPETFQHRRSFGRYLSAVSLVLLALAVLGFAMRDLHSYLRARSWIARQMAAARSISPEFAASIHGMRYLGTSGPYSVTVYTFDFPYDDEPAKEVAVLSFGTVAVQFSGFTNKTNFQPESIMLSRGRDVLVEISADEDRVFPGILIMHPNPADGEVAVKLYDTNWDGKYDMKYVEDGEQSRCLHWHEEIGWVEDQKGEEVGEPE